MVKACEIGVEHGAAAQEGGLVRVELIGTGLIYRVQHEHAALAGRQPRMMAGAQRRGADPQQHVVAVPELFHRADFDAITPHAGLDHRRRGPEMPSVVRDDATGRAAQPGRTMPRHSGQEPDIAVPFLARQRPDAVPALARESRVVGVPAGIRPADVLLIRKARPVQQVIGLGKEYLLNACPFLGEVEHELFPRAPDHACAQPDRVIRLVDDGTVVVKMNAVIGNGHTHAVPSNIGARVVQIEKIMSTLVEVEPGVPHARGDAGFEDHRRLLSDRSCLWVAKKGRRLRLYPFTPVMTMPWI